MDDKPPGIRRLCVAYEIDASGGRGGGAGQAAAERRGYMAFVEVCASLGLDRILLDRRNAGQLGVFPVGIDEPQVVPSLVEGLSRVLAGLNVRFRLAFHEGVMTLLAAGGYGGKAIATVGRLAESKPLRAVLAEYPGASLAVLLSASVFEDIGPQLPVEQFRRVEIGGPARGLRDVAWIYVPGHPLSASVSMGT